MGCTSCGACCDNLGFNLAHWDEEIRRRIGDPAETPSRRSEAEFILAHWHMRPNTTSPFDSTCDLYDPATRQCTAYEARPPVCSGYPYYSDGPNLARLDALPEQCGYRADWQPVKLLDRV